MNYASNAIPSRSESQKYKLLNLDLESLSSEGNSNKHLSSSPTSLLSDENQRNNNGRLTKRSSVDSGIHMAYGQIVDTGSAQKSKKTTKDNIKLSRLYHVYRKS